MGPREQGDQTPGRKRQQDYASGSDNTDDARTLPQDAGLLDFGLYDDNVSERTPLWRPFLEHHVRRFHRAPDEQAMELSQGDGPAFFLVLGVVPAVARLWRIH